MSIEIYYSALRFPRVACDLYCNCNLQRLRPNSDSSIFQPIAIFAKQARVKGERGWIATISTTSSPFAIAVLEVAVDDKGAVRVLSVDMAIGCGPQINPGGSALSLKVAPSWV